MMDLAASKPLFERQVCCRPRRLKAQLGPGQVESDISRSALRNARCADHVLEDLPVSSSDKIRKQTQGFWSFTSFAPKSAAKRRTQLVENTNKKQATQEERVEGRCATVRHFSYCFAVACLRDSARIMKVLGPPSAIVLLSTAPMNWFLRIYVCDCLNKIRILGMPMVGK